MKNIEIEDDLYAYIASQTQHIGETASDILRRLVMPENTVVKTVVAPKSSTTTKTVSYTHLTLPTTPYV